jgi:hypothetical protein
MALSKLNAHSNTPAQVAPSFLFTGSARTEHAPAGMSAAARRRVLSERKRTIAVAAKSLGSILNGIKTTSSTASSTRRQTRSRSASGGSDGRLPISALPAASVPASGCWTLILATAATILLPR